jgi:non-heme chloroperoxidase
MLAGEEPLELLYSLSQAAAARTPLLFVHGGHVGAWCWAEHFLGWFAERGFPAFAVSLRGHGGSGGGERLNLFGLADYARDVATAAGALERPPVLIGHSMGALVVQKALEQTSAPAAVLACPVPSYGLLGATLSLMFTRPALLAEIQAVHAGRDVSLETLAEALFAAPMDVARLAGYRARMQRESRRAVLDMAGFGLPQRWRMSLPETLVLGAEKDALIGAPAAEASARMLGVTYRQLPGFGHGIMLESHWQLAAQSILDWLEEQGL